MHKAGKILDFQPIRDLSHLIDLYFSPKLERIHIIGVIHNFGLLLVTILFLFQVLRNYTSFKQSIYIVAIFLLHPSIYEIYIEPTSRKHILSFLFFLISIYYFKKEYLSTAKNQLLVGLFFIFSIFSHPFSVFLPGFLLFEKKWEVTLKQKLTKLSPLFLISFGNVVLNYYYYSLTYNKVTNATKISGSFNPGKTLLYMGQHVKQVFLPINFSQYYSNLGSLELIFSLSFILLILYLFKYRDKKNVLQFLIPFFGIMTILYHRSVDLYYLNTYLLYPFFTFILLATFINLFKKTYLYLILAILFLAQIHRVYIRHDSLRFFKNAYANQPNCHQLTSLVNFLSLHAKSSDDFYFWGKLLLSENCLMTSIHDEFRPYVLFTLIKFSEPKVSIDKKIKTLSKRLYTEDLNFLYDAYIIDNNLKDQLRSNFNTFNYNTYFNFTFPAQKIKSYCEYNKNQYCNDYHVYLKRMESKEVIAKFKREDKKREAQ